MAAAAILLTREVVYLCDAARLRSGPAAAVRTVTGLHAKDPNGAPPDDRCSWPLPVTCGPCVKQRQHK